MMILDTDLFFGPPVYDIILETDLFLFGLTAELRRVPLYFNH